MGIFSAIVGAIGGLSAIMGIVVGLNVVNPVINNVSLGWAFWFALAAVLLLGSIALKPNQSE
jgi:zinc transporter ZupT